MTVTVSIYNGIRHGIFDIHGIQGTFPNQAIISTNLHHVEYAKQPNFDFKTKFLDIIAFFPERLRSEPKYRKKKVEEFSKIIHENPDKLCMLTIRGVRGNFKMTKDANEFFIKFQIECGFKLIRAFFTHARDALANSQHYRSMIPNNCSYVATLDENLSNLVFKELYLDCHDKGDEIVCFLGRTPTKQKSTNLKNKLNFNFILRREDDKIIRMTTFVPKSIKGVTSAYVYLLFGFDVYSYMTRLGNDNIPEYKLLALNEFKYEQLLPTTQLVCVLTGQNLYNSSKLFEAQMNRSSLPVSVHDVIELNTKLEDLHEKHTREELEEIVGNRFYRFTP